MPGSVFNLAANSWMGSIPHLAILIVVAACVGALAIKLVMAIVGSGKVKARKEWHVEQAFSSTEEITENPWRADHMPDAPMGEGGSLHPQLLRKSAGRTYKKSI